jgi:hypothetical protein
MSYFCVQCTSDHSGCRTFQPAAVGIGSCIACVLPKQRLEKGEIMNVLDFHPSLTPCDTQCCIDFFAKAQPCLDQDARAWSAGGHS